MILACQNIEKSFGGMNLIHDASFHIEEREKAALVGINGAGKSTLLRIIMQEIPADSGEVILSRGRTIGYLAQHQELDSALTIYDSLLQVKQHILDMELHMRRTEKQMKHAQGEELDRLMETYSRLTHEFEMENGYAYKSELVGVLKGLGFPESDFEKKSPPCQEARRPVWPLAACCCQNRISSFWMSLPTIWIWTLSPGWRRTF